jgi:3-keto-disaccharide hydrolase
MGTACRGLAFLFLSLVGISRLSGADDAGWISMFDGKTLANWKANDNPQSWSVKDGAILGDGEKSHLFWMVRQCKDCEFKADVKISDGGNSGMYFRTAFGPGFPKGYEAQVNSTHSDPVRTGSLYGFVKIYHRLVPPDTWFNQHLIARGNHIIIEVNEKIVVDFVDEKNTYTEGYLALQQHNKGSVVEFKNLMMKPLP